VKFNSKGYAFAERGLTGVSRGGEGLCYGLKNGGQMRGERYRINSVLGIVAALEKHHEGKVKG